MAYIRADRYETKKLQQMNNEYGTSSQSVKKTFYICRYEATQKHAVTKMVIKGCQCMLSMLCHIALCNQSLLDTNLGSKSIAFHEMSVFTDIQQSHRHLCNSNGVYCYTIAVNQFHQSMTSSG